MHNPAPRSGRGSNGALRVECISDPESMARLAPEWEAVSDTHLPWSPFLAPTWNQVWWRHFAESTARVSDRLCLRTVRSPDGALVAVAPLMLTQRPAKGPFRVRMLQFLGADPLITEARGVTCSPGQEAAVYQALLDSLDAERSSWDFMRWSGVPIDGGALPVLGSRAHVELVEGASAFVLDLPSSWSAFSTSLPRNIKESLRKCYNSLKRDGVAFEFRPLEGASAAKDPLDRFFFLHGLRARRTDTVGHNDVFAAVASRAFLRDYFTESRPGSAWIFQLVVRGEVVATRIGFRSGSHLYLYYSGYAPEMGQYSVMTTLLAEVLKWAINEKISAVHLSFGRDVSKTRWRPREVGFQEAQWSPSLRGRLLRRAFTSIDELRKDPRIGMVAQKVIDRFGARATRQGPNPNAPND